MDVCSRRTTRHARHVFGFAVFSYLALSCAAYAGESGKDAQVEAAVARAAHVFEVHDAVKDQTHPDFGHGSRFGFVVDGQQGKSLVLERGKTYAFRVDASVQHDFYFSTDPRGWGIGTVTQGVRGQFTYHGTVLFSPGVTTPDTLYYQCRNHQFMGGLIQIVDAGVHVQPAPKPRASAPPPASESQAPTSEAVGNKIAYADMIVNQSARSKNIDRIGSPEARKMLEQARTLLSDARAAFDRGQLQDAWTNVEKALAAAAQAGKTGNAAPQVENDDEQRRYAEMLGNVRNFEASYHRNVEKIKQSRGDQAVAPLDQDRLDDLKQRAEELAGKGSFTEANKLLHEAQRLVSGALSKTFAGEMIVYDKTFATPADEYYYEEARYKSYEELIPLAIEQKQPTESTLALMNDFVEKGKALASQAKQQAVKGDHKTAITTMQQATEHIIRALRVAGVQ